MFEPGDAAEDHGQSAMAQSSAGQPSVPPASSPYPFRLLRDETVIGVFPIASMQRPLGKLASFLFVTDSRLVYAAEAKSVTSNSTHSKEFQIAKISGLEVGRHRGYDALGTVALIGSVLNFLGLISFGIFVTAAGSPSSDSIFSGSSNPFGVLNVFIIPLAIGSLLIGALVAFVFRRPTAVLIVHGPDREHSIANERDFPMLILLILLFMTFGLFVGVAVLLWLFVREMGIFRATDAQYSAPGDNVDRVAFEAGALILDVQARGKFAAQP